MIIQHTDKHHGLTITLLCSLLHSAKLTEGRTGGRTDRRHQVHYISRFAVDTKVEPKNCATIDMLQYIGRVKTDVSEPFPNFVHYYFLRVCSTQDSDMHAPNDLITFHPYANVFFHHAESQFLLASGICKRIFDWLIAKTRQDKARQAFILRKDYSILRVYQAETDD